MKRFLHFLCAIFIANSTSLYADTFTVNGINYTTTSTTTVTLTQRTSVYTGHLNIPQTVTYNSNVYTVTEIANNAFNNSYSTNIKAITIPETITVIGDYAFAKCALTDSLIIKGSISSFGNSVFKSGTSINKLDIYDLSNWWNASFGETLSNPIFYCKHLYSHGKEVKSFEINITNIPDNAFQNSNFYTLIIGPSVKTMGTGCFLNSTIKKTIWLPNVIPSGTINNAIGSINYCSSTAYIEASAFSGKDIRLYSMLSSRFEVDGVIYAPSSTTECDVIDCNYNSDPVSVNIGTTVTYNGRP